MLPSHIDTHFTLERPHKLTKQERQKVVDAVAEVNSLIGNKETLRHCKFNFLEDTSKPIAALAAPQNGRL